MAGGEHLWEAAYAKVLGSELDMRMKDCGIENLPVGVSDETNAKYCCDKWSEDGCRIERQPGTPDDDSGDEEHRSRPVLNENIEWERTVSASSNIELHAVHVPGPGLLKQYGDWRDDNRGRGDGVIIGKQ